MSASAGDVPKPALARQLDSWLSTFEARIARASGKGQIEVHVSLEDARQLARLARIVVNIYLAKHDPRTLVR